MRLSIIIPVYNVEEYINKCVLSLHQQDIPKEDYEIIIINDGSPDNSRQVVLQLMQQFANIVFIDQKNTGVSMARNAGIDKAKGKYLLFIDPDDYVLPNCFNRILLTADTITADIVFLGFTFLNEDNTERIKILYTEFTGKTYTGTDAYRLAIATQPIDPDRSVAILYNRDFINQNQIRYLANVPYLEDGEFMARVLCLAERCIFEGNSFYIRTTRPGSATNSRMFYSDKAIAGFITAAESLKKFSRVRTINNEQLNHLNQPIAKFVLLAVQSCAGLNNWKKIFYIRKRVRSFGLNQLTIETMFEPYISYAKIYNRSVFYFLLFYILKSASKSISLKLGKLVNKEIKSNPLQAN